LRVDAHTHIFANDQVARREQIADTDPGFAEMYRDPRAKLATAGDLLAALERAGFDGAVAAGFAFADEREIAVQNEALAQAAADSRLAALATVNPLHTGWEAALESALGSWARGVGELRPGTQGWDPLGPAGHRLCEVAGAHGAVLLWHVSERIGHDYPGKSGGISAEELWRLAAGHPGVRMVAAHQGAGLPFFLQMPEVRESLVSISFDTAATTLLYAEESVLRLVDLVGAERVLFGSDFPLLDIGKQYARTVGRLAEHARQAVGGGNANRLFFERGKA
jgi:predicted TIM-barrel fold metal-dependent hydrolase